MELALVAVAYLESWSSAEEAITIVADQQMPYVNSPLYNQRELEHLLDVKRITDAIRWGALFTAVPVIGGLLLLFRQPQTRQLGYLALRQGGLLTIILLSGIVGLILFGWEFFFYQFHGLLFSSGSWAFAATDSLMLLYPEKFFFDVGVIMSGGTWLLGLLAMLVGYFLTWRCAQAEIEEKQVAHVTEAVR